MARAIAAKAMLWVVCTMTPIHALWKRRAGVSEEEYTGQHALGDGPCLVQMVQAKKRSIDDPVGPCRTGLASWAQPAEEQFLTGAQEANLDLRDSLVFWLARRWQVAPIWDAHCPRLVEA